jgi:hypothetical protein
VKGGVGWRAVEWGDVEGEWRAWIRVWIAEGRE